MFEFLMIFPYSNIRSSPRKVTYLGKTPIMSKKKELLQSIQEVMNALDEKNKKKSKKKKKSPKSMGYPWGMYYGWGSSGGDSAGDGGMGGGDGGGA